jgi:hypothetical protein
MTQGYADELRRMILVWQFALTDSDAAGREFYNAAIENAIKHLIEAFKKGNSNEPSPNSHV